MKHELFIETVFGKPFMENSRLQTEHIDWILIQIEGSKFSLDYQTALCDAEYVITSVSSVSLSVIKSTQNPIC